MEKIDFMEGLKKIVLKALETIIQGLANNGPLVGFMLLCIFGLVFHVEATEKDHKQSVVALNMRCDTLNVHLRSCMIDRILLQNQIDDQQAQINSLITFHIRKKR